MWLPRLMQSLWCVRSGRGFTYCFETCRRLCEDKGGEGAHAVELQLGIRKQQAEESESAVVRVTPETLTLLRAELQNARERMAALSR